MARTYFSNTKGYTTEKPLRQSEIALGFDVNGTPIFMTTRINVYEIYTGSSKNGLAKELKIFINKGNYIITAIN